jgi:ubiquinone biosynthesis protein
MGDAEGAARYLTLVAEPQRRSDAEGFRRAAAELSRRFHRAGEGAPTSLAQLILESIALGGRYRMFFPVEMVLMVKALVTFEAVGNLLRPGFDFATASRRHVVMVLLDHLSPLRVAREGIRLAPELIDALSRAPLLVTEGLRFLERGAPLAPGGRRAPAAGALFGGLCIVAGAVVTTGGGPWPLAAALFAIGLGAAWTARA